MELDVGFLELENGKCPYLGWEQKLDKQVRGEVRVRINRLRLGNFGDKKEISRRPRNIGDYSSHRLKRGNYGKRKKLQGTSPRTTPRPR